MTTDDVHLLGMRRAHFGAEHFFTRARCCWLHVQRAQLEIGLVKGIRVYARAHAEAAESTAALRLRPSPATSPGPARRSRVSATAGTARASCRCGVSAPPRAATSRSRRVLVLDSLSVRAAVTLELRLDPI